MGVKETSLYSEDHQSLFLRVFGSSPQLRLLDFFMDNPNHDFTRNEIMEAIGMAKRTLYDYLPVLVDEGAIQVSRKIGRAELFTLNKESPIVKCMKEMERHLIDAPEETDQELEEARILSQVR
ncbi:hypothetical protein JXL21_13815 [Candidatus Bathyarchaeota archaeon]|nr:hypothetical protein [Candidatus Bathyarchaeota archaeon]